MALDPTVRAEVAATLHRMSEMARELRECAIVARETITQSRMFIEIADERLERPWPALRK